VLAPFKGALVPGAQRPTDKFSRTVLIEQSVGEALSLPMHPRGDTFLDVARQLTEVVPELQDRSLDVIGVSIGYRLQSELALNETSDEFRALQMVGRTVGFLLHPDPPSMREPTPLTTASLLLQYSMLRSAFALRQRPHIPTTGQHRESSRKSIGDED
jgi:hypothetical protein